MRAITKSSFFSTVSPAPLLAHTSTDPRVTGGGYVLPARAEYFPFLQSLQKALSAEVGEVGVAFLEYCGSTIQTSGATL